MTTTIPRILHQTYATADVPERFEAWRAALRALHPNWEYRFYTDADCRRFIAARLPCMLRAYDHCQYDIQRVDLFRLAVVYLDGGFYLDLDVECYEPLDALCVHRAVFAQEKMLTPEDAARLAQVRLRVANYMFGAVPFHPFVERLLRDAVDRASLPVQSENDILESCGPGLVSNCYDSFVREAGARSVHLLGEGARRCPVCQGRSCQFGDFAGHWHVGSWRFERQARQRLIAGAYLVTSQPVAPFDGLSHVSARLTEQATLDSLTRPFEVKTVLVAGPPHLSIRDLSSAGRNVCFTTFETSCLPDDWVSALNEWYAACIVPHEAVKRVFEDSGVGCPIYVVHQGYTRLPHRRRSEDGCFRVGFLGVPQARKNLARLFEACSSLARQIPELRLAVHAATLYDEINPADFTTQRAAQFVEWTEGKLGTDALADWYAQLSAYCFPSSGEGWSFTPRESLSLGIPTILSDIPVHQELIASGHCHPIPSRGSVPAIHDVIRHGRRAKAVYGRWEEITAEDIAVAIENVYRDPIGHRQRAEAGAHWIADKWTNEETVSLVQRILGALAS